METVRRPSVELWEEIIRNCEHATFFHSPIWTKVLEKTYPHYSNATVSFTFNTGNRAIFPLVAEHSKGILFKKAQHKSMALGVYGGILAERRLTLEETGSIFEYLTSIDIKDLKIVENPFENYDFPENFVSKSLFTHIVPLNADFEQLRKRFSRGQKSNIKQAEKKGITVRLANSLEDYEQYYTIYQETIKRWGKNAGTTYPWRLFLNLLKHAAMILNSGLLKNRERSLQGYLPFTVIIPSFTGMAVALKNILITTPTISSIWKSSKMDVPEDTKAMT